MRDELGVKAGYTIEDVSALMETLRDMVELEEGELYTLRKGTLQHVMRRDEENGLRRIRVMEEAYDAAQQIARRLRHVMRGYRPDPALVISALVMDAARQDPPSVDDIVQEYLQRLFQSANPAEPEVDAAAGVMPGAAGGTGPVAEEGVRSAHRRSAAP